MEDSRDILNMNKQEKKDLEDDMYNLLALRSSPEFVDWDGILKEIVAYIEEHYQRKPNINRPD